MRNEIVIGMDEKSYRSHPGLSYSELKLLWGGVPAECRAYREEEQKPIKALDFGTLTHFFVIEKERFIEGEAYHIIPEEYPSADEKTGKVTMKKWTGQANYCKDWKKDHADLPCIPATGELSLETIVNMRASMQAMPEVSETLSWVHDSEVAVFAECPLTGQQLKCRIDWLGGKAGGTRAIVDFKTSQDSTRFERDIVTFGYWIQDQMYRRILKLNGVEADFFFVPITKTFPHCVRIGKIDEQARARNDQRLDELLEFYSACSRVDYWPSFKVRPDLSRVGLESFNLYIKDQ